MHLILAALYLLVLSMCIVRSMVALPRYLNAYYPYCQVSTNSKAFAIAITLSSFRSAFARTTIFCSCFGLGLWLYLFLSRANPQSQTKQNHSPQNRPCSEKRLCPVCEACCAFTLTHNLPPFVFGRRSFFRREKSSEHSAVLVKRENLPQNCRSGKASIHYRREKNVTSCLCSFPKKYGEK